MGALRRVTGDESPAPRSCAIVSKVPLMKLARSSISRWPAAVTIGAVGGGVAHEAASSAAKTMMSFIPRMLIEECRRRPTVCGRLRRYAHRSMGTVTALPSSRSQPFWEDMAASEHMVQIYGSHGAFIAAIEGFVASSMRGGESAIVIASAVHLHALEKRLRDADLDIEAAR